MDRRDFIRKASLGAGTTLVAPHLLVQAAAVPSGGHILEPAREIPVVASASVVVVGGGPAGFAAALAAAREGADVLLVERLYFLGGLFTGCGVTPIIDMYHPAGDGRTQAVAGVAEELCNRLEALGMLIVHKGVHPKTDPEAAKYVMETLLCEAGVRVLYGTQVAQVQCSAGRIEAVVVEGKGGRAAIRTSFVIDCSGDGDVLSWTDDPFTVYKDDIGAMWRIGNAEASAQGSLTPVKGVRTLHMTGLREQDGLDMFNLSQAQIAIRKQIWEMTAALKGQEGCTDLYLVDTPSLVGVRVTRVLDSVCNVSLAGAMEGRTYPDVVGIAGAFTDIDYGGRRVGIRERKMWQVPYSSLTPRKTQNLLVAGRCFGFERGLTYDAREIGTCLLTGQAAGVAAALALDTRTSCRDLDIPALHRRLRRQHAAL